MASTAAAWSVRQRIFARMAGGTVVLSIPVAAWWYQARQHRAKIQEDYRTKVRLPPGAAEEGFDYLITHKCQAGDVLLFDRKC